MAGAIAGVIVMAILTPFVAIQAGAAVVATGIAIAGISVVTETIGGVAAGLYWGHQAEIKRQEQVQRIMGVTNQLDIYFEPSTDDPERAANFECTLVLYEVAELTSETPTITTKKLQVKATNSRDFYEQVHEQMRIWFSRQVLADSEGQPCRVTVYMKPYPGEGIYDRLKNIATNNGIRKCVVTRVDGPWVAAVTD